MKKFFEITDWEQVFEYMSLFPPVAADLVPLSEISGRVLAADIVSDGNLPDFARATMDGYAVRAASTYGASEGNPAYLSVKGTVAMGESPRFSIGPGEAARISTGGMLPSGTDSVIMIEHTEPIDDVTIEVYRSVAPGQHQIEKGEDFKKGDTILSAGQRLRPQETGLLAAFGIKQVKVFQQPVIGIISTGDEVIPIDESPQVGQIRDINSYTLSSLVKEAGGVPMVFGIVGDDFDALLDKCTRAFEQTDMTLISGGSSVGSRDFTIEVFSSLPDATILFHGIPISPGKPTILADVRHKPFWGLPGHVVSAMIVFTVIVRPFLERIAGLSPQRWRHFRIPATLTRNISSAQGRIDYIRVRLNERNGTFWAEPILGKSGLINTMVKADGLIEIGIHTEGLDQGSAVEVIPF